MEAHESRQASIKDFTLVRLSSLLISSVDDDPAVYHKFQTEFHHRFKHKFFDRCHKSVLKLCGRAPDWEEIRDDIFQESFITAFEKIKSFEIKAEWDDVECEKVLLFWLASIANNKILKRIANQKKEKEQLDGYEYFLQTEHASGEVAKRKYEATFDQEKFGTAWQKLSDMSREIIIMCAQYDTLDEDNSKHLPDEAISYLTKRYNVKSAAVRKAKQRALSVLKSCKIL